MYIVVSVLIIFGVILFDITKLEKGKNIFSFFLFVVLVAMSAFRYRVGGDALFYENMYIDIPVLSEYLNYMKYDNVLNYQPLWILFSSFCKTVTEDYVFFKFLHSLIFNITLFYFLRKNSKYFFSVLAVLWFSLMYLYFAFEVQRETMAISFFLLAIPSLKEKKWLKYYLLVTVSVMFHISAIILFILPLLSFIQLNTKNIIIIAILTLIIDIPFKLFVLDALLNIVPIEAVKARAMAYSEASFSALGFVAHYSVRILLLLPLAFYLYRNNNQIQSDFQWAIMPLIIVLSLSLGFVGFDRFANYLYIPYFILITDIIYSYKSDFKMANVLRNVVILITFLHVFFITEYKLFVTNQYGQRYLSVYFPYTSIFEPEYYNAEREGFYHNQWEE